jgi:selenocysteine-specific elongation factor
MKNIVAGVIGHVDHGKTTLVKHLTGVDTDRLKLEQERGMSIELGFAPLRLPSGHLISLIDVPGHEDFLKNMIRGVSGVDIAVLVVAADEGIMPQTVEHLDISALFGVKKAVGIITKTDLVDAELLGLAKEEVQEFLSSRDLKESPILSFSARTGEGREQIIGALQKVSEEIAEKDKKGVFRLCIDRVFTLKGHGTIVTGTITSGTIEVGEEVEIYPSGITTRIKRLESHGDNIKIATAGQRLGINLHQVKVMQVRRGEVLGRPGEMLTGQFLNGRFHYTQHAGDPIPQRCRVKIYTGTTESIGRMILIDKESALTGESCLVQIRLEEKLCLLPFDRYVIRRLSPSQTLGGGATLEIDPPRYRRSEHEQTMTRLLSLEEGNYSKAIEEWVKLSKYHTLERQRIAHRLAKDKGECSDLILPLVHEGRVIPIAAEQIIHRDFYEKLKGEIVHYITLCHERDPLQEDFPKEEPRTRISPSLSPTLYDHALQKLQSEGAVIAQGGRVRLTNPPMPAEKRVRELILSQIETVLKRSQPRPLPLAEIIQALKGYHKRDVEAIVAYLVSKKRMIRLDNGRFLHTDTMEEIKEKIRTFIIQQGKSTLAEAKELLGIGRMQAQPILDYLDKINFTIRVGDYRILCEDMKQADAPNGI